MVESLVLLSSLGGECPDDLQTIWQDQGLETIMGFQLPAPSTVRGSLDQCHDDEAMAGGRRRRVLAKGVPWGPSCLRPLFLRRLVLTPLQETHGRGFAGHLPLRVRVFGSLTLPLASASRFRPWRAQGYNDRR